MIPDITRLAHYLQQNRFRIGERKMSKGINDESRRDQVVFETLSVRKEGTVLFVEIAARP
jgi:hypothetical protein